MGKNYKLGLALGACVAASACASVLGIEELGSGTDGGAGGTSPAGSGGDAIGNSGGSAGSGVGVTGGNATGGGDVEGGVGTGGSATGGAGGQATADAGGDVFAGDGGPSVVTVQGRVIDRWRHLMANVPILINGKATTTDAAGAFSMTGVQTPYDVALVVPYTNGSHSWLYQGISRANPTLQVDTEAQPFRYANYFDMTISHPSFPLPANTLAGFSWGSPDGIYNADVDGVGFQMASAGWSGPVRSVGTSHALKWTVAADNRPTGYNGYDFLATTLEDPKQTSITLDLTKNPAIAMGPVSGTITRGKLTDAYSDVYVSFNTGASIKVVDQFANATTSFSYIVPTLAGATATICVQEGARFDLPYAVVHKSGLAPNQAGVSVVIPSPSTQMAPAAGATVTTTTDFTWAGDNVVYLFVAQIQDTHYRVLTTQKTARLPKFVPSTGIVVPASKTGGWQVETHGPFTSMDAATDVKGFVDPFDDYVDIAGPLDRDGERLTSTARNFTTSAAP